MVQAISRSKARLTERQQFWLDHLRVCREQGHTLRGYAPEVTSLEFAHASNSRCRSRRHFTKQPNFAAEPVNSNVRLERDQDKQSATQPCAAPNSRAPLSVSSAYRWQAVQCPGSTSARGGVSARQRSSA